MRITLAFVTMGIYIIVQLEFDLETILVMEGESQEIERGIYMKERTGEGTNFMVVIFLYLGVHRNITITITLGVEGYNMCFHASKFLHFIMV